METLINLSYWLPSLGFLMASIITILAIRGFGRSVLGSIFSYLFIGTGTLFFVTIFQKLGADFFGIGDESVGVWWHIIFYMALVFYYVGLRFLVSLGNAEIDADKGVKIGAEKQWMLIATAMLAVIFIIPETMDSLINFYLASPLAGLGLHHFLAVILSGVVGSYLLSAKKNLGQIGRAVANPMIVAIWALGLQHFWELLTESWKVIIVSEDSIEGIEKIFLMIASISIAYAAWRLKSFAK